MLIRRFITSILLQLLLLTCGMSAFAQFNQAPTQWVDDLLLVHHPIFVKPFYLIDEKNVIKKDFLHVTDITDFPVPQQYRVSASYPYWHNGSLNTLAFGVNEKDTDGSEFTRYTFARWQDDEWQDV